MKSKEDLEAFIEKSIICDAPKKSKHCFEQCRHGKLHIKETEKNSCHMKAEFCSLSNSGIIKVICRPLSKKQQKKWVKENLK